MIFLLAARWRAYLEASIGNSKVNNIDDKDSLMNQNIFFILKV